MRDATYFQLIFIILYTDSGTQTKNLKIENGVDKCSANDLMLCEYLQAHSIPEIARQSQETNNDKQKTDGRAGKCGEKTSRNVDGPMRTSKCGESKNCQFLSVQPFPEWSHRTDGKNGKITDKDPVGRKTTEISEDPSSCSCNQDEIIIAVRKRVCDKHRAQQPDDRQGVQKTASGRTSSCPREEGCRDERNSSKCKSQTDLARVNGPARDAACSVHKQPSRSNVCGPCRKHSASSAAPGSEKGQSARRGHSPRRPTECGSSHRKRETTAAAAEKDDSSGRRSPESRRCSHRCSIQQTPSSSLRVCGTMNNPVQCSPSAGPCRIRKLHPTAAVQDDPRCPSDGGSAFVGLTASLNHRMSRSPRPCRPKTSKAQLAVSTNGAVRNPVVDNAYVRENVSARHRHEPNTTRQRRPNGEHYC